MVQMRSVDDDVGGSAMEVSQTPADNQPWHATIIQLFIGCSVVEVSQTPI